MAKKNVNVEEAAPVAANENVMETVQNDVEMVSEENIVESMPRPQTMNYEQSIKLSDAFVNDLHKALDGFSYSEVAEIFKAVDKLKDGMPINVVNEVISRVASFPYKSVKEFMTVIETDQARYLSLNDQQAQ